MSQYPVSTRKRVSLTKTKCVNEISRNSETLSRNNEKLYLNKDTFCGYTEIRCRNTEFIYSTNEKMCQKIMCVDSEPLGLNNGDVCI